MTYPKTDPSYLYMIMEIVSNLLKWTSNPESFIDKLTDEFRELTGAKTVILMQCHHYTGKKGHEVLGVNPKRKSILTGSLKIKRLMEITHGLSEITLWNQNGDSKDEADNLIKELGYGLSVCLPLDIASHRLGAMFFLGLPMQQHLESITKVLNMTSGLIALILSNAILFNEKEQEVLTKTNKLEKTEQRYQTLAEFAPVGIFHVDEKGDVLYVNYRWTQITGLTVNESIGKNWTHHIHPTDRQTVKTSFYKAFKEQTAFKHEFRFISKESKIIWVYMEAIPEFSKKSEISGYLGSITDVTNKMESEIDREELVRNLSLKNQELESIIYISSHDLKTPLVNIMGYSQELKFCYDNLKPVINNLKISPEDKQSIIDVFESDFDPSIDYIRKSTFLLDKLQNGLLKICRLGQQELNIEHISMKKVINDVINNLSYVINKCEASIKIKELPECYGDYRQIHQAFINLIENSIKYLDKNRKGIIEIAGKKKSGYNVYYVKDNGIGIPKDYHKNIFQIFNRIPHPEKVDGEGLGLTIVKRIITMHGGEIHLDSIPGKSTCFTLTLPNDKTFFYKNKYT